MMTNNRESASKEWDALLTRTQKDPFGAYPFFVPTIPGNDNKDMVKWIELMRSPEEMQYIDTRTELKQTVGALFGVMPIFQADLSTSSGLNNEGLTITVTTRAIESGQKIYNEQVLPWLLRQFAVTDWKYMLNPPEEKDEMAELQREAQEMANAEAMKRMGFEVKRSPDGKFIYSDKPTQPVQNAGLAIATSPEAQPPARLDGQPDNPTG